MMKMKWTMVLCGTLLAMPVMAEETPAAENMFKMFDTDNNGVVSEQEYVTAAAERARRNFKRVDANNDGQLTTDEVNNAGKRVRKAIEERRQPHDTNQ